VSDAPTIAPHQAARIGPGRLVLVVGPSGAGKDTLLNLARAACAGNPSIVFPRRLVTREASAAEDNVQLDDEAFERLLAEGALAVHWGAHGHRYALPRSVENEVRAGHTVVANVSRTVVDPLRRNYAYVVVVAISAPPDVLAERLALRRRGSDGAIDLRLARSVDDTVVPDITIVNVGDPATHADRLVHAITVAPPHEPEAKLG
jgi:ribose 1,5-bisphosphokinase